MPMSLLAPPALALVLASAPALMYLLSTDPSTLAEEWQIVPSHQSDVVGMAWGRE